MVRILLTYVVPLVMPLVGWYVWQRFIRRTPQPGAEHKLGLRDAPWHWLSIAGVLLVAATLGSIALFTGGEPGEVYQPPQVIDGKVVPGRHQPPAQRN